MRYFGYLIYAELMASTVSMSISEDIEVIESWEAPLVGNGGLGQSFWGHLWTYTWKRSRCLRAHRAHRSMNPEVAEMCSEVCWAARVGEGSRGFTPWRQESKQAASEVRFSQSLGEQERWNGGCALSPVSGTKPSKTAESRNGAVREGRGLLNARD